jgi:hypothetical protein
MKAKHAYSAFFIAVLAGCLWWTFSLGDFFIGYFVPQALIFLIVPPFFGCLLMYVALRHFDIASRFHSVAFIVAGALAVPLWMQPWSPRVAFFRKVESIQPGMTKQQVAHVMKGYIGGEWLPTEPSWVPGELMEKRVTHLMHYRWTNDDGRYDADIGQVFLRGDKVVGTRSLTD